jgi:hypothetical protein
MTRRVPVVHGSYAKLLVRRFHTSDATTYVLETWRILRPWLGPVVVTILVLGTVLALTKSSTSVPFAYTLF